MSTQVLSESRNLGFTQLVQFVADFEQVSHGEVHLLHFRSVESPQKPLGQLSGQVAPLRNVLSEQAVQEEMELEHFKHGRRHLHVQSLVSPKEIIKK